MSSVPPIEVEMERFLPATPERVVFALSAVTFMDSSRIAMLLRVAERVAAVAIRRPSSSVQLVLAGDRPRARSSTSSHEPRTQFTQQCDSDSWARRFALDDLGRDAAERVERESASPGIAVALLGKLRSGLMARRG